jgi:hypothetical protein
LDVLAGTRKEFRAPTNISGPLVWSPSGDRVYYWGARTGPGTSHWVLDLPTDTFRELTESYGGAGPCAYRWYPDNIHIVVADRFGSLVLNTDDGSTRALVYPPGQGMSLIDGMFPAISTP